MPTLKISDDPWIGVAVFSCKTLALCGISPFAYYNHYGYHLWVEKWKELLEVQSIQVWNVGSGQNYQLLNLEGIFGV
jgi:hypothetical protein